MRIEDMAREAAFQAALAAIRSGNADQAADLAMQAYNTTKTQATLAWDAVNQAVVASGVVMVDTFNTVGAAGTDMADALGGAASRLGITLNSDLISQVSQLSDDLELMADHGIDAVSQMSDETITNLGKMLTAAQDAGVEIPTALQPILDIYKDIGAAEALGDAAGRLGITLTRDLGEQVAQLTADLEVMSANGIDAVSQMSDATLTSMGEMLIAARNAGIEIPDALQPIIDAYADLRVAAIDAELTDLRENLELRHLQRREQALKKQADAINDRYDSEIQAAKGAHDVIMANLDARKEAIERNYALEKDRLDDLRETTKARYEAELERIEFNYNVAKDKLDAVDDAIKGLRKLDFLLEPFSHTSEIDRYIDKLHEIGAITDGMKDRLRDATRVNTDAMDAVLQKYGLGIEELGAQFHKQKAFEDLQELASDLQTLQSGGANIGDILRGVNADGTRRSGATELHSRLENAVKAALKYGVEDIPEILREPIRVLGELGGDIDNLTDQQIQSALDLIQGNTLAADLQDELNTFETLQAQRMQELATQREEREAAMNAALEALTAERNAIEQNYRAQIEQIALDRSIAETNLAATIAAIEIQRAETLEPIYARIAAIEIRREEIETARWNRENLRLNTEIDRLETEKSALVKSKELAPAITDAIDAIKGAASKARRGGPLSPHSPTRTGPRLQLSHEQLRDLQDKKAEVYREYGELVANTRRFKDLTTGPGREADLLARAKRRELTELSQRISEGRAYGGPVSPGQSYVVGELGPELFVPTRSGNIVPNGMGIDSDDIAKKVGKAVAKELRANPPVVKIGGQTLMDTTYKTARARLNSGV